MKQIPNSLDSFRRLALAAVATNLIYIVWLGFHVSGFMGYSFWFLELMVSATTGIFVFNHWTRRYELLGGSYSMRSSVDVYIPTVDESVAMLNKTIAAAAKINHPRTRVYVLDDGARPAVARLAKKYQLEYITRQRTAANSYKAANLNNAMAQTRGDFVLVIDADNIVSPTILDDLLGHFKQEDVGIVASRQAFTVADHDFNHDHLFYNYMQSGKNSDGAAISCGSGVIYRRSALDKIGGFSEWNLVEDLFTTYIANSHGIRSIYVSQPYVKGHAPTDLSAVYKQRGTWAVDTLRMLFWKSPLLNRRLNLRQRMHYFEIGYCYLVSAFMLTGIYLINDYALITNQEMVHSGYMYILFRAPALIFTMMLFGRLSQGQLTSQIWAGLFPVYVKATFMALLTPRRKPRYRVTPKIDTGQRDLKLITVQVAFIAFAYAALLFNLSEHGFSWLIASNIFWITVMTYWLTPIIQKGLNVGRYAAPRPRPVVKRAASAKRVSETG